MILLQEGQILTKQNLSLIGDVTVDFCVSFESESSVEAMID